MKLLPVLRFTAAFFCCFSAVAQDSMYVHKSGGSVVKFALSEVDSVTFAPSESLPGLICSNKTTIVSVDATSGNNERKNFYCRVSNTQVSDTIYLDIKAPSDMDFLYITQASDNGTPFPLAVEGTTFVTESGIIFSGGTTSTYTYKIGSDGAVVPTFKIKIPYPVRTDNSAINDIYTFWLTTGAGDFSGNGKKNTVKPFTVTLHYGEFATPYLSAYNLVVGDQISPAPSYVTTSGLINVVSPFQLLNATPPLTAQERTKALNSIDIQVAALNAAGTAIDASSAGKPYVIGIGKRASLGFTVNTEGTNITRFALYTQSKPFETVNGNDLLSLTNPSADKIQIETGKTYVFLTEDGRKGIFKVTNLTSNSGSGYVATVSIKISN